MEFGRVMGIMAQRVICNEDPFAVFYSGSPRVEHGNPNLGWIWLFQNVTPEPVSNRAQIFSPPIDISAFGLEYSGLEVLKQLRAVRHVRRFGE